jgi:hypothetical protein
VGDGRYQPFGVDELSICQHNPRPFRLIVQTDRSSDGIVGHDLKIESVRIEFHVAADTIEDSASVVLYSRVRIGKEPMFGQDNLGLEETVNPELIG